MPFRNNSKSRVDNTKALFKDKVVTGALQTERISAYLCIIILQVDPLSMGEKNFTHIVQISLKIPLIALFERMSYRSPLIQKKW